MKQPTILSFREFAIMAGVTPMMVTRDVKMGLLKTSVRKVLGINKNRLDAYKQQIKPKGKRRRINPAK